MNMGLISDIGSFLAAIASLILCYQLILIKKHFNEEHRIRNNRYANDLIRWWVEQVKSETAAARKFVERLGSKECENIDGNQPFQLVLPENNYNDQIHKVHMIENLKVCLSEEYEMIEIEGDIIKLNASASNKIRSLCTKYLNSTESVLSARRHGLANKRILEEEFFYIVHLGRNYRLLLNFREASGGKKAYPAIYDFIEEIEPKLKAGEKEAEG